MPVGTYIVASEPVDPRLRQRLIPCGAAVCDTNFVLDYFRFSADHRMLYGGRVSYSTATPANLAQSMQRRMAGTFRNWPTARSTSPGGFVDITMNRAPISGGWTLIHRSITSRVSPAMAGADRHGRQTWSPRR